jgi:hypothetical protein
MLSESGEKHHFGTLNDIIIIIIIIVFITTIIVISFMQGIYSYIPETKHVYRECSVAAIL